jgi:2-phosphoglycerate kinase
MASRCAFSKIPPSSDNVLDLSRSKLQVRGAEGTRPFMRGILVRSLVARGVPFEIALDTATRVREELGARGSVDAAELVEVVERLLPEYELDLPQEAPEPMLRVRAGRGSTPFSKGLLAVSLEGAGIDRGEAWDVALQVESRLRRLPQGEIERSALRRLVAEILELRHGERVAERYSIWRQAREAGKPLLLLLGGATGVGKTSVAIEVARRLEIARVIGTDSIRQIMRLMFSPELMPEIYGSTFDAYLERGVEVPGADPAVAAFRGQAQKIAVGVRALLDRAVEESASMLIEGANLLPSVLDLDRYRDQAHVIFLIVGTLDAEAYRDRFRSRAAREHSRDAARYLGHMREILAIQDHLVAEAEHYGLPVIDNEQFDETVLTVIRSVLATLKKSMATAVEGGA